MLLRLDVDQFMTLGDSFGHLLADRVVTAVGQILGTEAGQGALVARIGSEAFVALLPGQATAPLMELAERIRSGVERCHVRRQDNTTAVATVTVSIGAIVLRGGEALAASISRAEQALEQSREEGGNRITVGGAQGE